MGDTGEALTALREFADLNRGNTLKAFLRGILIQV